MSGKEGLPLNHPQPAPRRWSPALVRALVLLALALYVYVTCLRTPTSMASWMPHVLESLESPDGVCPQVPEYDPMEALQGRTIYRPSVREAVERISNAIQIDTSIGDGWNDPSDDPEPWRIFTPFAEFLQKSFPNVHEPNSPVQRETIHEHGLLYTWPGSDPTLKPLLLMAHQDVVPVDKSTESEWYYPPFSGHIDLKQQTVWGRGATDCKLWLLSSMTAIESLLKSNWKPRRTIHLAYGFDEESAGVQGAQYIGNYMKQKYGEDSIAMIVDEGTPVLSSADPESFGMPLAAPSVTEKGSLNLNLEVRSPGGHSSMPPEHTSIGFLSKILTVLEENPFPDKIEDRSKPMIRYLQCMRDHPKMPEKLRSALILLEYAERSRDGTFSSQKAAQLPFVERLFLNFAPPFVKDQRLDEARKRVLDSIDFVTRSLLKTTQAEDVIRGGVKVNALPESAKASINHRIATYSNLNETMERYKTLLKPLAQELRLSFSAFDQEILPRTEDTLGSLTIGDLSWVIDTRETTPFEGENADAWRLLSGVIRQTWHLDEPRHELQAGDQQPLTHKGTYQQPLRVSPNIMFASSDTHWYMPMTHNIFGFGCMSLHPDLTGKPMFHSMHTVNEHVSIDAVMKCIDFYTNLVIATDHENIERV